MSLFLLVIIFILSFAYALGFVAFQAKKFALDPPSPLIDLDRMYDVIFSQIDEKTGQSITPDELSLILNGFVRSLEKNKLLSETIKGDSSKDNDIEEEIVVEPEHVLLELNALYPNLDVPEQSVLVVIKLAFTYLNSINAVT